MIAWYCVLSFHQSFQIETQVNYFPYEFGTSIIFPNSRIYPTVDWLSKNLPHCVWNEFQIAITYTHSVFLLGVPAVNFTSMWVAILVTERIVRGVHISHDIPVFIVNSGIWGFCLVFISRPRHGNWDFLVFYNAYSMKCRII